MDEEFFEKPPSGAAGSLVDSVDQLLGSLAPGDPLRRELLEMRMMSADQEDMMSEARQAIEKLEGIVRKVTSPANRIGTFLGAQTVETAQIVVGGADYYRNLDPRVDLLNLRRGTRVLVNEAYVIVGASYGYDKTGPVTKVTEVLGHDRLRVGAEHGVQSTVLQRSDLLMKEKLKVGDGVRVDANHRIAIEVLARPHADEYYSGYGT